MVVAEISHFVHVFAATTKVQRNKNIGKLQAGYLFPEVRRFDGLCVLFVIHVYLLSDAGGVSVCLHHTPCVTPSYIIRVDRTPS